jgi:DNA-binding GntR family transcriptional regulator
MRLKRLSLAEQAYQTLLTQIISGKRPAGEKLTEEGLCKTFDISRTPAREALVRLERDGLVERNRRCGWKVSAPDKGQVKQLFECRRDIECLALRHAIENIPREKLEELKALLEDESIDARKRSLSADEELHTMIGEYCGNKYLTEILNKLRKQTAPYRFYRTEKLDSDELLQERNKLLESILERNIESALILLSEHIAQGARLFEKEAFNA